MSPQVVYAAKPPGAAVVDAWRATARRRQHVRHSVDGAKSRSNHSKATADFGMMRADSTPLVDRINCSVSGRTAAFRSIRV
jgi:hypothetical protein